MKTCSLLFLIISFLIACKQPAKEVVPTEKERTGLELSAVVGGFNEPNKAYILTTLYNPTKDTQEFVTMTCSYENYFVTDTTAFQIMQDRDCNKNHPTIKQLPPGCKIDQYVIIYRTNDSIEFRGAKLRVGMYNIKIKDAEPPDDPSLHMGKPPIKKFPIIWSNSIDMDRIFRKVYK